MNKILATFFATTILAAGFASAAGEQTINKQSDYYFVTLKGAIDQPVVDHNQAKVNSVDTSFFGGLEAGKSLNEMLSLSLEYDYFGKSKFNISDDSEGNGTTDSYTWGARSDLFLANITTNLSKNTDITPYVKVGLGASRNKVDNYVMSESGSSSNTLTYSGKKQTKFAYRISLGASMSLTEKMDFDVAYAFTSRGKVETNSTYYDSNLNQNIRSSTKSVNLRDHALVLGVKFKF